MTHKAQVEVSPDYASKPYAFDKSVSAQKRSSSMSIANRVVSVKITPDIETTVLSLIAFTLSMPQTAVFLVQL